MAPPKLRRPGFSRRAQYGLFISYIIAVGGIVLAILMLIIEAINPQGFNKLKGVALDITAPVSSAGGGIMRFFTTSGHAIEYYFMAASQNNKLQRQLEATERKLIEVRALEYENTRLKQLLKISNDTATTVTNARIVNSTFNSSRRLATLAAGSSSGVEIRMPVRSPDGLIGRVIETGYNASRVLLITDGASNVPVRLLRNGTPAMATGRGDGTIEIRPLESGQYLFRPGDILVTSGTGGIYSPNIPTAIVVRVSRDEIVARPLANPARSDFVTVQRIYQDSANVPLQSISPKATSPRQERGDKGQ